MSEGRVIQYQCSICKKIYTSVGIPLDDIDLQKCPDCNIIMGVKDEKKAN